MSRVGVVAVAVVTVAVVAVAVVAVAVVAVAVVWVAVVWPAGQVDMERTASSPANVTMAPAAIVTMESASAHLDTWAQLVNRNTTIQTEWREEATFRTTLISGREEDRGHKFEWRTLSGELNRE
ncbi:hypothetical protein DdX_13753 [Ditylenchus destructor]|uniref:Uncharacterized protein n=1 Tax=Ditylenchus destructor TaxID=166010 RepID=A0AAD4QWA5_9BILA|nr:hypothetical protein DdX_13753 [Ditylenchus destructor]